MTRSIYRYVAVFPLILTALSPLIASEVESCYDETGNATRCIPEFVNAAFNVRVNATNTCGWNGPTEYCIPADGKRECKVCDSEVLHLSHPSIYMTDVEDADIPTWWQSETIYEGIQYPNSVNLTLHLGKTFEIAYVSIKFHSSLPESFAIYKKSLDHDWEPYQYYSASCNKTYGVPDSSFLTRDNETTAICTSEFTDILPLSGEVVTFSTLDNRPSAYHFEDSAELQEWVKATDIKITLNRLNTFGDERFGSEFVLKSYYYAISNIAVGARCQCNGHASECLPFNLPGGSQLLACHCEHFTAGPDCDICLPSHNDVEWKRATTVEPFECKRKIIALTDRRSLPNLVKHYISLC